MDARLLDRTERHGREHGIDHAHIGHIELQALHAGAQQTGPRQLDGLQVRFLSGVAIDSAPNCKGSRLAKGRSVRVCTTGPQ